MKYDRGWDVWGIYTGPGSGRSVAEPMGRWVAGSGWLGGGKYIRRVRVGSLYYIRWPSLFLEFVQQWFPGFAEVQSPMSVNVIRMHFPLAPPQTCLNPVRYKYPAHPSPSYFIELPLQMELIECSETSTISTQTPGKHPKENILQIKITFMTNQNYATYKQIALNVTRLLTFISYSLVCH
jgi:hypothetical protein